MSINTEYKQEQDVSQSQGRLSPWDYVNLYFVREAPSLSKEQNSELFEQLKNVGMTESLGIYINSSISYLIIYMMLWLNSDYFNHSLWLLLFIPLTLIPILVWLITKSRFIEQALPYKQFAIAQTIVLPCGILGWAIISLVLVPKFGHSSNMSLSIITAASVYTVIWFKTFPLGTLLWTAMFFVIFTRVFYGLDIYVIQPEPIFYMPESAFTSSFLALIFVVGVNGLAIYLFIAEISSQLNKIALAQVQSLNQLLVNTFEKNSKDFLWQSDNKGEITYASSQLQKMLKVAKNSKTLAEPNALLDVDNQFGPTLRWHIRSKESFELVLAKMQLESVMEYWSITGDPLYNEEGEQIGFSGFGSNVTAVQQAEYRKNQIESYRSMTRMASMIGHDFNNYLATIGGCVDLIGLKIDNKKAIKRHLSLASESMKDAEFMTTQLLDLGDKEVVNIVKLNLKDVLKRVVDETLAVYPSGLKIKTEIPKGSYLYADATQLARSARNILENAASSMGAKGTITIEVETLEANSPRLKALKSSKQIKTGQDYLVIRFSDTGAGFLQDHINQIFEPFMTTKADKGGRGLGLAMVANFCLQLQGFAIARNGEDGAIVELVLPKTEDAS